MMGPTLLQYALTGTQDAALWTEAARAAEARDFDQTVAAIAAQADTYAALLSDVTDSDFRAEAVGIDGKPTSRGALIVNGVLLGCAAYRTQLFLYLKACGRKS
jgi:hypothetical protein